MQEVRLELPALERPAFQDNSRGKLAQKKHPKGRQGKCNNILTFPSLIL
jgi:hypothetical protein